MDNQPIEIVVPIMSSRDKLTVWHNFSDHCWELSKPSQISNSTYMNYITALNQELKKFNAVYDYHRRVMIFENHNGYSAFILTWS